MIGPYCEGSVLIVDCWLRWACKECMYTLCVCVKN